MMIDIHVFTVEECAELAERLVALRPRWINRASGFSTFGVATYLDVLCSNNPEESYYARLADCNDLLLQEFGVELERVRTVLSDYFQVPARYETSVALPGFHIFEEGSVCTADRPSMHFDLQHRFLRWPFGPVSDDVISFTLAIKLPRLGGGLDVWDITEDDMHRMERMGRRMTMEQLGRLKPMRRHEYRVGIMAVQLRPLMHRISAIQEQFPGDKRITLQGHGVRDQNGLVLYW